MSALARKLKTKGSSAPSRKLVRLPDGTVYKCDKKVREHNLSDLRLIAAKIGLERDAHFFFVTKNVDGMNLLPACFPRNPSVLLDHISRIYFLYHLSESSVSKCLSMENPKDLTDTHLLNDVVLINKNNLQPNPEDAEAARAILDSEQAVIRLLGTLLCLPELTTQWYRVKDQGGKVYQLGITSNGLLLRPEFDGTETSRLNWTDLDMPRIHRSTIRIPLKAGTVITDATLSSFVEYKKNKRLTLSRRKPSQSSSSLRSHGDVQSSRTAEQTTDEELELVFHTVDSFTAKRLTYQLNCTRVYALREGQAGSAEQPTQFDSQEQHPGPFSRLNRQFRDTFRRVAKPFSKKTKKSEAGEQEDLSANELDEDKLTQTAAAALPSPIENAAIVKPSGDSPNVASSTVPSVQTTTSTSVWKTATSTAEVVVTTPNAVAQPTTGPKTPASFSSSPSPSEPPVPVTLPIIGHTTNAGIVGNSPSSTITHTFHVSHNLPHGTSFQTHGSVIPVLPTVSRAPIHEPLVEPIGVVAAGEADFKLDECEDRILQSLPNPVFDSTKMNRSPPTTPQVPASPNTYSLGIKSTAISPVTPTSPSSLTSFGANTQSAQSERFDRSPLDDSPSIVSTALAKCVKDSENLNASSTSPEMNANREFCADILAQALTVEPEAALSTPAVITMDSTVARSPREIPSKSVAEPQVAVENSATIHSVTVLTSENVALTPIRTDQTTSKQPASVATGALTDMVSNQNCKPNIELNHGQMRLSPTRETSPITAVSQLRSFSSSKTSSYTSPTEAASRHSQTMYAEEDKDGPSPSPLPHTSVSTFGQSESSGNMATALTTQIPRQTDPPTCALSQSASFQSRLRAPMISVPRPVTESDTWSRTPEFPAPYRPLSTCSAHTDLSSTKVTTPELTQADLSPIKEPNTLSEIEVSQTAHMKTVSDSQSNQVSEANAHVQSGDQVSSMRTGPRNSGIRPPCVKVPGGSADSHSTEQTRLESPLNPSNGSPVTSTRISVPEAHVSTHIKPPEVKVAPSGIKPPSITMNVSGGSRATGIPTPGSVAVNGTGSKNGSVSSVPTATPATGIRLPSRVPKPSTNRA